MTVLKDDGPAACSPVPADDRPTPAGCGTLYDEILIRNHGRHGLLATARIIGEDI